MTTQYTLGAQVTSTAVATTAMSSVATPAFVVREQYGAVVVNPPVTLYNASTPYAVNITAFTSALPES